MGKLGRWILIIFLTALAVVLAVWAWPTVFAGNRWLTEILGEPSVKLIYYVILILSIIRLAVALYHQLFLPSPKRYLISSAGILLSAALTIIGASAGVFQLQHANFRWQQAAQMTVDEAKNNQSPPGLQAAISLGGASLWPAVATYAILALVLGYFVVLYTKMQYVEEDRIPELRLPSGKS